MKVAGGSRKLSVSVSKSAWNHLCVTWTRLTGYVSVYVNATLLLDVHLPSLTRLMHDGASIRLGAYPVITVILHGYDRTSVTGITFHLV